MYKFSSFFSFHRIDLGLLIPAFVLIGISLASLYSIDSAIFKQQLIFVIFSIVAYILFLNVDYHVLGYLSRYIYIIILVLLSILFVIGIEAKGAVRWIDIFGVRLQFSEIAKPFFIIVLANYLATNPSRSLSRFFGALMLLAPIFFLILRQPDLGNALIYAFTTVLVLLVAAFPLRYFLGLFIAVALPFPLIFQLLHGYQQQRLLSFVNLTRDPFGSSYNAIQSLISIGSGGFFGKGFGQATQSILKFLPERHTDFIFASTAESLGFVGGLVMLAAFGFLLYRVYVISIGTKDQFSRFVALGIYFLLLSHVFLNIGMNTGVVPIVGITLPLVSYGGSSLVTFFICLGILSSIASEAKVHHSLEIR